MVVRTTCSHVREDGSSCGAAPQRGAVLCWWHDPEHAEEVKEAQRLGGQRRRRERVLSGVFDFEGLGTIETIRRLVEVAAVDTLGLENSVARNRALASLAQVATGLLEKGEWEQRLDELEAVLEPRKKEAERGKAEVSGTTLGRRSFSGEARSSRQNPSHQSLLCQPRMRTIRSWCRRCDLAREAARSGGGSAHGEGACAALHPRLAAR